MSDRMPFGAATLVIPFTMAFSPPRRPGGGMSRMTSAAERYRDGVKPPVESSSSIAPVPEARSKSAYETDRSFHEHPELANLNSGLRPSPRPFNGNETSETGALLPVAFG